MRVVLLTIVWAVLSLLIASGSWFLLESSLFYFVDKRGWLLPEGTDVLLNGGAVIVMLSVPSVIAVLGMRGKLPGTRRRVGGRGFSVLVPEDRAESRVRDG
jgi:hypothetical protein